MKTSSGKIKLSTKGNTQILDITEKVQQELKKSGLKDGIVNIFVPGATGAITTMEYEPGLVKDLTEFFKKIIPENEKYNHDSNHINGNAHSHIRASLIGPSINVPFENGNLILGTWQQIVFIDFDTRARTREIILKIIGE